MPTPTSMMHPSPMMPPIRPAESPDALIELELTLAGFSQDGEEFRTIAMLAARQAGGELLFDLPASGLIERASRIAALRVPSQDGHRILFASLGGDGRAIDIIEKSAATEALQHFAEAFVSLLEGLRRPGAIAARETAAIPDPGEDRVAKQAAGTPEDSLDDPLPA